MQARKMAVRMKKTIGGRGRRGETEDGEEEEEEEVVEGSGKQGAASSTSSSSHRLFFSSSLSTAQRGSLAAALSCVQLVAVFVLLGQQE